MLTIDFLLIKAARRYERMLFQSKAQEVKSHSEYYSLILGDDLSPKEILRQKN